MARSSGSPFTEIPPTKNRFCPITMQETSALCLKAEVCHPFFAFMIPPRKANNHFFCFKPFISFKYRVVFSGEKCKGEIVGIVDQNAGYVVGGVNVKKHAYIVLIKNKKYYTVYGCLFLSLGRRKIGKEIVVFKNEKYGKEVFKCFDFRIEIIALVVFLFGAFLIFAGLR